jgi:hypothetical protein
MSMWKLFIVSVIYLFSIVSVNASVITNYQSVSPDDKGWQTLTSKHFQVHFTPGQEQWAVHAANVAENFHQSITQELDWVPENKTQMVLTDNYDFSNGWASTSPFENIRLILSPPDSSSALEDYDDWLKLLIIHEYTHIVHMDKAEGLYRVLRRFLGRNALFFPNAWQPRWIVEGYATHKETDFKNGFGRGQSSGYHMRMRAEVLHGLKDLQSINVHAREWPGGSAYLYGAYFMQFISDQYGQDAIAQYIKYYSRNIIPYWLNPRARQAFDKDFLALWSEFQQYLKDKFEPEIAKLKAQGLKQGQQTLAHSLSPSTPVKFEGHLYFTQTLRTEPSFLSRLNTQGKVERIMQIDHTTEFDINRHGDAIMTQFKTHPNNRYYQDLYLVKNINDPTNANMVRLTHQQRWRVAKWFNNEKNTAHQNQIIAKRIINSYSELALLDNNGQLIDTLWRGKAGEVLGQFDSHNGRLVAALKRAGLDWDIVTFNFNTKQWQPLVSHQGIETQPKFATDGRSILYAADYSGSYNVYRYDLGSGQITQVSQVDTGGLHPSEFNQSAYYWYYASNGYELREISLDSIGFVNPTAQISSQFAYDFNNPGYAVSDYQAWQTLRPYWWWPIMESDESKTLIGFITGGQDTLGKHNYQISAQVDPDHQQYQFATTYQYANSLYIGMDRTLTHFAAPENDQVYAITAENSADFALLNLYSAMDGDLAVHAGLNWQRQTLVYDRFNTNSDFDVSEATALGLGLVFSDQESYIDSAGTAFGNQITAKIASYDLIEDDFEGKVAGLSFKHNIGFASGDTLSLKMEYATADEQAPIFYLGSDQSSLNPIDYFQNDFNLRGFKSGQFFGDSVQTNTLTWRTKLSRVERSWNIYPIGINDIELSLFSDFAAVGNSNFDRIGLSNRMERLGLNADDIDGKYHVSTGVELKIELNLGFRSVFPLYLGFAKGYGDFGDDEFYTKFGFRF